MICESSAGAAHCIVNILVNRAAVGLLLTLATALTTFKREDLSLLRLLRSAATLVQDCWPRAVSQLKEMTRLEKKSQYLEHPGKAHLASAIQ